MMNKTLNHVRTTVILTSFIFLLTACAGMKKGLYPDSEMLSCSEEPMLKSESGDTDTTIFLSNQSDKTVVVRWINYEGVRDTSAQQKITLKPRRWVKRNTYLTHPFVFTDLEGNCVAIFRPRATQSAAIHE